MIACNVSIAEPFAIGKNFKTGNSVYTITTQMNHTNVNNIGRPKMPLLRKPEVEQETEISNKKLKTQDLVEALGKIRGGISTKGIVEGFGNYSFDNDMVRTYNDHLCISYPFKTGIVASVNADALNGVLNKIGDTEIVLSIDDNSIVISGTKTRAGLITTDIAKHITISGAWQTLPKDFIHGLSLCAFSAADNMSMGLLYCLFVENNKIYSSDNFRISRYEMESDMQVKFLIPSRSAEEVTKFDVKEFSLDDSWIHFKSDNGAIFSCRIVAGNYKDVNPFFQTQGKEFTLPQEIRKYVDASLIMAEGKREFEKRIEMTVSPKLITIKGETQIGWIESKVPCDIDIEEEFKISINPIFLNEILSKTTKVIVGEGKALFQSENFDHVMVLP
jgi:hypothetical protein